MAMRVEPFEGRQQTRQGGVTPVRAMQSAPDPTVVKPYDAQGMRVEATGIGALARGQAQFSQGMSDVGRVSDIIADDIATGDAKKADADYAATVNDILYNPSTGFLTQRGGNAMVTFEQAQEALRTAQDKALSSLDGRAREKAHTALQGRTDSAQTRMSQHFVGQRNKYLDDASVARVAAAKTDAMFDPASIDLQRSIIVDEVSGIAARNGMPAEAVQIMLEERLTEMHEGIISATAQDDPLAAKAYLQNYADEMNPAVVADMMPKLDKQLSIKVGREAGAALANSLADPTGVNHSLELLRRREGYIDYAKWDVDAMRGGYGSDTITRADGTVEKVTANTKFTREDAERDLRRRVTEEFMPRAARSVGQSWHFMNGTQRGVLTSIAYNYGSVPDRVLRVIHAGGNDDEIAAAIRGLASDNQGINAGRRIEEAGMFKSASLTDITDLAGIENEDEKRAALSEFSFQSSLMDKQAKVQHSLAINAADQLIMAGVPVQELSYENQTALGPDTIVQLANFQANYNAGRATGTFLAQYPIAARLAEEGDVDGLRSMRGWLSKEDFDSLLGEATGDKVKLNRTQIKELTSEIVKDGGIEYGTEEGTRIQLGIEKWLKQYPEFVDNPTEIQKKAQELISNVYLGVGGDAVIGSRGRLWGVTSTDLGLIDWETGGPDGGPITPEMLTNGELQVNGEDIPPDAVLDAAAELQAEQGHVNFSAQEVMSRVVQNGF